MCQCLYGDTSVRHNKMDPSFNTRAMWQTRPTDEDLEYQDEVFQAICPVNTH